MANREVEAPAKAWNRIAAALHRSEAATIGAITVDMSESGEAILEVVPVHPIIAAKDRSAEI